jgi:hypothetical protein
VFVQLLASLRNTIPRPSIKKEVREYIVVRWLVAVSWASTVHLCELWAMTAGRLPSSKRSSQAEICQAAWIAFALAGDGGAGNKATSVWPRQRFFSCMVPCMFALSISILWFARHTISPSFVGFHHVLQNRWWEWCCSCTHKASMFSSVTAIPSRAQKSYNKSLICWDQVCLRCVPMLQNLVSLVCRDHECINSRGD